MATTFRILLAVALFGGALSASSPAGSAVLISGGGSNGVTAYQAVQGDDEKLCQVLPEDADDLDRIGSITAVIEGNFLLSCGGQSMNSGKTFENCWKTDLNSTEGNHWEQANPLPTAVAFAGTAATSDGSFVYVLGGSDVEGKATDRIQVYDVRRNQWTESNDTLPRPTSGICAAMHKDEYIVVIGSEVSGAMDTNTGNWIDFEEFPSEPNLMPVPKVKDAGCIAYDIDGVHYIFVAGGRDVKSGAGNKAFLVSLGALPYGVAFPLPDMIHERPHSPTVMVDTSAGYDAGLGHVLGGSADTVDVETLDDSTRSWIVSKAVKLDRPIANQSSAGWPNNQSTMPCN